MIQGRDRGTAAGYWVPVRALPHGLGKQMVVGHVRLQGFQMSVSTREIGRALHSVFDVLLESPGTLYNPLFVGPLPRSDAFGEAFRGLHVVVSEGAEPPDRGIWLATASTADAVLSSGRTPRPGVQWVVWDPVSASALPDRVAAWVGSKGLAVDPVALAVESAGASLIGGAVAAATRSGIGGLVVAIAEEPEVPAVRAELLANLEVEIGGAPGRLDSNGHPWVVEITGGDDPGWMCARLASRSRGAPWAIVSDAAAVRQMRATSEWRDLACRTCVVDCRERAIEPSAFPSASELFLPGVRRNDADAVSFNAASISLPEILLAAEGWAREGTLVVFDRGCAGWISVSADRVGRVGVAGESAVSDSDERGIHDVLVRLSGWTEASVVFLPGFSTPAGGGVPIGRAVMAVAHSSERVHNEGASGGGSLAPGEVAEVLVGWGLVEAARSFLLTASEFQPWGPAEEMLLARLLAEQDAGAALVWFRSSAIRAYRELAPERGAAVFRDALISALVVGVRLGVATAAGAWSCFQRLSNRPTDQRELAIGLELSLRAGDASAASDFQRRISVDPSFAWPELARLPIGEEGRHGEV